MSSERRASIDISRIVTGRIPMFLQRQVSGDKAMAGMQSGWKGRVKNLRMLKCIARSKGSN